MRLKIKGADHKNGEKNGACEKALSTKMHVLMINKLMSIFLSSIRFLVDLEQDIIYKVMLQRSFQQLYGIGSTNPTPNLCTQ